MWVVSILVTPSCKKGTYNHYNLTYYMVSILITTYNPILESKVLMAIITIITLLAKIFSAGRRHLPARACSGAPGRAGCAIGRPRRRMREEARDRERERERESDASTQPALACGEVGQLPPLAVWKKRETQRERERESKRERGRGRLRARERERESDRERERD